MKNKHKLPKMTINEYFALKLRKANESLKELIKCNPNLTLKDEN